MCEQGRDRMMFFSSGRESGHLHSKPDEIKHLRLATGAMYAPVDDRSLTPEVYVK